MSKVKSWLIISLLIIAVVFLIVDNFMLIPFSVKLITDENDAVAFADVIMPMIYGEAVNKEKPWNVKPKFGGLYWKIWGYTEYMMGYPAEILVRAKDGKIVKIYHWSLFD